MVTAGNIPDHIEADLGELEIGETINISDITLPEGTRPVISDRDFVIANIAAPGGAADDEDEDENAVEDAAEDAAEGDAPEADAET